MYTYIIICITTGKNPWPFKKSVLFKYVRRKNEFIYLYHRWLYDLLRLPNNILLFRNMKDVFNDWSSLKFRSKSNRFSWDIRCYRGRIKLWLYNINLPPTSSLFDEALSSRSEHLVPMSHVLPMSDLTFENTMLYKA